MKKFFVITALVLTTVLYVFTVSKSYEYMNAYSTKSAESSVRKIGVSDPIKGSYVETIHTSFYTCPKRTSARDLDDKNDQEADKLSHYYTFGVESSCRSSYIVTQIQSDGGG